LTRPYRTFRKDVSRDELMEYIRTLEGQLVALDGENDALDSELSQLRSCLDPHCQLCSRCVTTVFLKAKPAPLALPRKYVEAPWRR
jgi:hypothetical protein